MATTVYHGTTTAKLAPLLAAAALPRVTLHDLRHSYATLSLRSGVPLKVVSEVLGHAGVGITADLYSHVSEDMQVPLVEAFTRSLAPREPSVVVRSLSNGHLGADAESALWGWSRVRASSPACASLPAPMTDTGELPDYLRPDLRIVFIGINPSVYSVQRGHYFARKTNRFWPAFSRSRLSAPVRAALGRDTLGPQDDARLLDFGIGFTDVVKRASRNVSELDRADFERGVPVLLEKLRSYTPGVAVFHGMMGYRPFLRYGLGIGEQPRELGPQPLTLAATRVFVVPSPSPANAHFTLDDQVRWYDELAQFCDAELSGGRPDMWPAR
jgi:TDG/mug DNA glycosylase family protein